ncbi:hypothetical protein J22TS3_15390 [Paenibacillus sp. J22TS3]|nr:hypothetical protein J22TS3_15390 [Paenibacillus sp. J22TS3]
MNKGKTTLWRSNKYSESKLRTSRIAGNNAIGFQAAHWAVWKPIFCMFNKYNKKT